MKNRIPLALKLRFKFLKRNNYFLSLKKPKTFNEKINFRKVFSKNELFSICSDKIAVKEYLSNLIDNSYLINTIAILDSVNDAAIKGLLLSHDSFVIKANHNSGHIHFIDKNSSDEKIAVACKDLNRELGRNFGKRKNEYWYSSIKPRILIEENIKPSNIASLTDYKFHSFKQADGSLKIVLCVIFNRDNNPHCSYFDEDLNWIPIQQGYPCIQTHLQRPKNYDKMLDIVKILSSPFNYVRVDLYNIDGQIKFGELTFADGSGLEKFSSYEHDLWLGGLWTQDPCL